MENQSPTAAPPNNDESDSLEGNSTVVEPANGTSDMPVTPAPVSGSGASKAGPQKTPDSSSPPPPGSGLSLLKRLLTRLNIYLVLFIVIILVTIASVTFAILHNNKPTTPSSVSSQSLSSSELSQLQGSNPVVGTPQQNLTIQSNATFGGTVLVKSDLSIAGTLKVGGALNLPGISVSGTSNFGTVQANSLTVTGNVVGQGNLTVQKTLSVAGGGNFGGVVSTPQLVTQNLQLESDLQLSRHVLTIGNAPSRTNGSALGDGGTASISGTDTAGTVTLNIGSSPGAGCFVTLNFATKFTNTPHVVITPVGASSAGLEYYVTRSASSFSICSANAASASQSFNFDYIVIG